MHGGSPAFPQGPPRWPLPDVDVAAALAATAEDGSWGRYEGPHAERLLTALRASLASEHVYLCCSGTFAVELALRMLRVGPGDEVILAGYDFAGNFRAVEAVGATPVLVDIVPNRWHVDVEQLDAVAAPQMKAVLVSHLHGVVAPMREIVALAQQRGWSVVEDACQVSGAVVDGRPAGTWGHVGTLSFGGSKLLTAGRGGAVITSDATLLQRAKVFCEQGNHAYPLSELQAAVLPPQIGKLNERTEQRCAAVERIRTAYNDNVKLTDAARLVPCESPGPSDLPAYYKMGWLVDVPGDAPDFNRTARLRDRLVAALQAEGIGIDAGFRGFGRRSEARCRKVGDLRHARQAAAGTLVLHHPVLLSGEAITEQLGRTIAEVASAVLKEET
jgi:dTDP-4-amino-4,6-dideoxygalactose transaminase